VGRADVARMLRFLGEYVASHFRTEEQVMREVGHPDLTEHTWEHERFTRRFLALTRALEGRGDHRAGAAALGTFLADWLELHVGGSDQRLRELLPPARGP
jgi:hemerythrin